MGAILGAMLAIITTVVAGADAAEVKVLAAAGVKSALADINPPTSVCRDIGSRPELFLVGSRSALGPGRAKTFFLPNPTINPRPLTIDRESVDSRRDGRFLQTDLVCRDL